MSATPRTDDEAKLCQTGLWVPTSFAEQLEQELSGAMTRAQSSEKALCALWRYMKRDYYHPECATEPYRAAMEAARAIVEARKDGV